MILLFFNYQENNRPPSNAGKGSKFMTAKLIEIRAIKDKRYPMPISETIPVTLTKPTGPITESATFLLLRYLQII